MKKRVNSFLIAAAVETPEVNPWMILPFAALLLSIAICPLVASHWWHRHYPKVAVGLGAITIFYYLVALQSGGRMVHIAHEYVSFIALIGSLYVVSGGIHLSVKGESTPLANAAFLFVGAVIANVLGTTGASMLLIRPWIRMNHYRITAFHIVFFIFIVSNAGGCLTPIGDPPLFLGYLKGVPFFWVLEHCWAAWLICVTLLIAIFLAFDFRNFAKPPADVTTSMTASTHWKFEGGHNLPFIAVILGAVLFNKSLPLLVPELLMVTAAVGSYFTTSKELLRSNHFNFEPIREVAWLFVGIFATMAPALDYLERHASSLGLETPMQFYWATGGLSALLDNAPTYLTFLAAALGDQGLSINNPADVMKFIESDNHLLVAISLGAVFFGAGTYIGNGPNFMVKNIAAQVGVRTPGFFSYLFFYAVPILLPVCGIIAFVFFSPWRIF